MKSCTIRPPSRTAGCGCSNKSKPRTGKPPKPPPMLFMGCFCAAGFRSHVDAIELHFNKSIARKQIPAATKPPINSIGGGFGGFPVLGLLLFEQPHPAVLDGGRIVHDFIEQKQTQDWKT